MCKFTTIILLCSAFWMLSIDVKAQNVDVELLRAINSYSTEGIRDYSKFLSNTTAGVAIATPLVMGIVGVVDKNDDLLKSAICVGATIGVSSVLTYGLKHTFNRPRPAVTYPGIITSYEDVSSLSFPSGHTSLAFCTATSLSLQYPKWYIAGPALFWAGSVGYSRMHLGVHYPSDVLAGALLGAGSAYITYKINKWYWKKNDNKKLIGLQAYQ